MALDTYTALQAAILDFANRPDKASLAPDLITLAEAKIRRRVRRKTVRSQVTFGADTFPLPADCAQLRSVRLVTGTPGLDGPMEIVTPEALADYRTALDASGTPRYAAEVDGQLMLVPIPQQPVLAELVYFQKLVPLATALNGVNLILTEAPDIYLYGALVEISPYLERDERIETWKSLFDAAIDELNLAREREEYSASVRPLRLPRVFD